MDTLRTQTILLVEDEENDVVFMEMALEKAGLMQAFQVAEDGAEAIDYLSGQGEFADRVRYPLPAVVLLDLKLPKVMGMDVLKWIRNQAELDTMVVIMLTSSQQRSDIRMACSLGANSYLVKPSNPLELGEIVELIKRYWLKLNQPTAAFSAPKPHVVVEQAPPRPEAAQVIIPKG
jgi:DNA-binding response OmpR family regulator